LVLLIRSRTDRRDWAVLVDTATITTGLGLLAWVFLIRPAAGDPTIGLLGHAVSVAYPVGDVVLLAMMVRLQLGSGIRTPAFRLMMGCLLGFLAGDLVWAAVNQLGVEPGEVGERSLNLVYLFAYVLCGAAALHPSVRGLGSPDVPRPQRLSPGLLVLLTAASLVAPGVLAIEVARGAVTDGVSIVIGCVVLFTLVVIRMAQLMRQLERQAARVRELSNTDDLTGLPNRRAWTAELPRAIEHARRGGAPLCVALLDLDHFKRFNDAYGHPAGDRLLKAAAAAWQEQLRAVDHLARYGGEEFILLLPDADAGQAAEVLARLRQATPLGQTFSAGLAEWRAETSDELVSRADAGLYAAKRDGRDRVTTVDEPSVPRENLAEVPSVWTPQCARLSVDASVWAPTRVHHDRE